MNTFSILVIDRNEHSRTALVRTLEQAGYRAKGVETGGGMLAVLCPSASTPPYGLVLLDWDLPTRSVHEVLCRLRDQHLELPVVVLIEQFTPEQVGSAIHLGGRLFNEDYHRQLQVLVAQTAENLMDAPLREIPVEQDQAVRGSTGGRAEHGEHPSACLDPVRPGPARLGSPDAERP